MRTNDAYQGYLDRALAESGSDPVLRAQVLPAMSMLTRIRLLERIDEAEAWALEALAAARQAGPDVERLALEALGWSRSLRGKQIDDVSERLLAVSDVAPHVADSLEQVVGQRLVWRGEVDRARSLLTPLLTLADERGEAFRMPCCGCRCASWSFGAPTRRRHLGWPPLCGELGPQGNSAQLRTRAAIRGTR